MPTNLIVNGSFDVNPSQPGFGWSGTDLETTYSENTYQGNGSTDSVAEVNGGSNQTTVMEQTFTVDNPQATQLTFEAAIRDNPRAVAGTDGYTVEITDSTGAVILSSTILPTDTNFQQLSFDVTFPAAGDYTLTITEVGDNDSHGALIDDIALMVCLTAGTLIETPCGPVAVQDLTAGSLVSTRDGPQALRWIGSAKVSDVDLRTNPKLRPVRIMAGALGGGLPLRDLLVSRQHRMLVSSRIAARMFGQSDVLVNAIRLTDLPGIMIANDVETVTYFHLLFDAHQIIQAEGAPTESLLAGPVAMAALSENARQEILTLFPQLGTEIAEQAPAAMIPPRGQQRQLVYRHHKNQQALNSAYI